MAWLWFTIGVVFGSIVTNILFYIRTASGCFKIDRSDPLKDTYRLEIDDLDKITKKKRIILKINNNADLSQK